MSRVKKIGNPVLRKKTEKVTSFDQELLDLVANMTDIILEEKGIGLAANQAGISKAICIINISQGTNPPDVFINPEIIEASDIINLDEECYLFQVSPRKQSALIGLR